jgi:epoxyqueuosine reductase
LKKKKQITPLTQETLRQKAYEFGFDQVGFIHVSDLPEDFGESLHKQVEAGYYGTMQWMEERLEHRSHPVALWGEVQTIISLGTNYGPDHNPLKTLENKNIGNISVYARHQDYHDVIKKRLKAFARWMVEQEPHSLKVFVDTAPVMEKPLAVRAGIGWQGKHTNVVSRKFGSWLFLSEIFTTLSLASDEEEKDHCGRCQKCYDICPTQAFIKPYVLDARRCISYLTIEHQGQIPLEFRSLIGNRIYGCDDCLSVCPWNKFAKETPHHELKALSSHTEPSLDLLARFTDETFREHFRKSPVKRIGVERFTRNVLIAIGNSGNQGYIPLLYEKLLQESSLIRGIAVWALSRLMNAQDFKCLALKQLACEKDLSVRQEWQRD